MWEISPIVTKCIIFGDKLWRIRLTITRSYDFILID